MDNAHWLFYFLFRYYDKISLLNHWGVVQRQHTSLWSCGSWFESERPSHFSKLNHLIILTHSNKRDIIPPTN